MHTTIEKFDMFLPNFYDANFIEKIWIKWVITLKILMFLSLIRRPGGEGKKKKINILFLA
jgi:hypothetical protein